MIHLRFGPPKTAKERAVLVQMEAYIDQAMEASFTQLAELLRAELDRQAGDAVEEPELPLPRPDGLLRDLPAWR